MLNKYCFFLVYAFLKIFFLNKYMLKITNMKIKMKIVITDCINPLGAKVSKSINGKPKTIAGKFCKTKLVAIGVLKVLSTSFNNNIPVDAVPVNIPNIAKNDSCS